MRPERTPCELSFELQVHAPITISPFQTTHNRTLREGTYPACVRISGNSIAWLLVIIDGVECGKPVQVMARLAGVDDITVSYAKEDGTRHELTEEELKALSV